MDGYPYIIKEDKRTPVFNGNFVRYRETVVRDKMITALIAAGEIPETKQENLVSVIDLGKPVNKSI